MLTHRTNVLLTHEDYQLLTHLATKKGVTRGALIRYAINKAYNHSQKAPQKTTAQLFQEIRQLANTPRMKGVTAKEIKQWINDGRRF